VGQEDSTPSFLDMTIWQRRKQCSVVYAFMFFDFFQTFKRFKHSNVFSNISNIFIFIFDFFGNKYR